MVLTNAKRRLAVVLTGPPRCNLDCVLLQASCDAAPAYNKKQLESGESHSGYVALRFLFCGSKSSILPGL